MKRVLIICVLLTPSALFSQELKFSSLIGVAITEMKDFKKIALCTGFNAGCELPVNENLYITFSAGGFLLRFDYRNTLNASVFSNKYFINLPLSLKRYYEVSKKSKIYWDFGILAAYQFFDKREIRSFSGSNTERQKNLGLNFGATVAFGFKTNLSNRLSFDLGFMAQTDYLFHYKQEADKTKTDKKLFVISLCHKLKK